jgi:hypothetical protein
MFAAALLAAFGTLTGAARAPAAAPAPAAKVAEGGPPLVLQAAPISQLLDDLKAVAKIVGGEQEGAQAVEHITQVINGKLGEKGFAGIDTKKPAAAFLYIPDKLDIAGKKPQEIDPEGVLRKFKGGLAIPITKPDEFKDFVARLFDGHVTLEPVAGKDGLFKMDNPQDPAPFPIRLRYLADHAYVGINMSDDDMEAKTLPAVDSLVNPKETAQFALRFFPDRYPPGLMKEATDAVDAALADLKKQIGDAPRLGVAEKALESYVKLARRYSDQLMKESNEMGYRVLVEKETAVAAFEFYIVPKKGTSLAKDVADRKPGTNKFAGLVAPDAAAGATLQLPLFAEEIKEILVGLIDEGKKQAKDKVPPPGQPVVEELLDGLARTVKTGEFDVAAALTGPDKDGHFTAVAAIAYEDAGKLEKALRDALKDAPKEVKDAIQLDAAKAGDVSIHKITPPEEPPPEVGKVFGATSIYAAFGPKGIYVAFGTEALDALKKALAAKPGPALPLDVKVNPKKLQAVVTAAGGEQAGQMFAKVIGTEDKMNSVAFVSVSGGESLRVRFGMSLKFLPRATAARAGAAGPPPAIIK